LQQQRIFEYGDALEMLLFEQLTIPSSHDEGGLKTIGGWWNQTDELRDPSAGLFFFPSATPFFDRQRHVELNGYFGHADALCKPRMFDKLMGQLEGSLFKDDPATASSHRDLFVVIDAKSANRFSYDRASVTNLEGPKEHAPFLREYAIQQNLLCLGLKQEGLPIDGYMLVFLNKEHGPMMFRYYPFNPKLAAEGLDRLASAEKDGEPVPDWDWVKGDSIPLRCSYCEMKESCAKVRGFELAFSVNRQGKPEWRPR